MSALEPLLTPKEVAQILQVSRDTVYKLLSSGQLKGIRVGLKEHTTWRITRSDLSAYLNAQRER